MKKILLLLPLIILGYASFSQQDIKSRWIVNINGFRFTLHNAGDSIFKVKTDSVLFGKPTNLPFSTQSALTDSLNIIRDSLNILRDSLAAYRAEDTVYTTSGIETVYSGDSTTIRLPYKSYVALISQSGTDAPTAIVLQNDFDETFTFVYSDVGDYAIISANSNFTENKTTVSIQTKVGGNGAAYINEIKWASVGDVQIYTYDDFITSSTANDILVNTTVEIKVFY